MLVLSLLVFSDFWLINCTAYRLGNIRALVYHLSPRMGVSIVSHKHRHISITFPILLENKLGNNKR